MNESELDAAIDAEYGRMLAEGLSTAPTDRVAAVKHITTLLAELDLKAPPVFRWFSSMPALLSAYKAAGGTERPWFFYGRLLNYWYSRYRFAARPEIGLLTLSAEESKLLCAIEGVIQAGAYWEPFDGGASGIPQVFCADGPTILNVDQDGQFHSERGPAIAWADGKALYAWHGVFIPAEWITAPATVDPGLVLNHPNAELARCLGEILGWDAVLSRVAAREVACDSNPLTGGVLLEVQIAGVSRRFVRVICGTGRTFVLEVDPSATTVLGAIAGTYGVSEAEYAQLEART